MSTMKWLWLSFADPGRPEGTQFLGACIVQATDVADGARWAWALGINPGGQVACWELPPRFVPNPEHTDRLLDKEQAMALADMEPQQWGRVPTAMQEEKQ